jgi:intracellular sulfur oxidation DsrE/DsrF family protein
MKRRSLAASAGGIVLAAAGVASARADTGAAHKVVFHVGSPEPLMMGIALHNIANFANFYKAKGETVTIELVANGPGYNMLRADKSPVKELLAETQTKYPTVIFSACQQTRHGMAAAEHKKPEDIPELPGVTDVPSGVVRLAELQAQGYAYIRV